ncbi:actinorhodin polyketide synthase [Streptomyces spinoverrucosus]|uniref:Actinorhodin polyketide synthase n=1 Tax=Streptomyces spinoverrucosus TaxID=284043 RepID=A0A4Y3VRY5_9ACTN|nr:acyl carrier protein [Streptomyces spinoverrucosus]GEC09617.1 actinorhodin polyketide synthase [Streptomyces spinoverrucosus]GHB79676.1 actinorhodin polyketide synthase [Streptomyces spinoverrucosus]
MSTQSFSLDDLKRILLESAGADENIDLDGDILDTDFEELSYESLAILETCGRIERDYGISLDDSVVTEAKTPRALLEIVNTQLAESAQAA